MLFFFHAKKNNSLSVEDEMMKNSAKLIVVFLISTLMLMLQLLQTRIFSVIYWSHLVYFIITMALLGIAVSGTVLSLSAKIRSMKESTLFSFCLIGFSVSALLGIYIITKLSGNFFLFWKSPSNIINLILSYFLAMLPFFFFGLLISAVFFKNPERSGLIYFSNLSGTAAGCLLYVVLIKPLGAVNLLILIFVVGSITGISCQRKRRLPVVAIQSLLLIIMTYWGALTISVVPEINKQFWTWFENPQVEFSQWNAISRIDVVSEKGNTLDKAILIDGDAQTTMIKTNLKDLGKRSFLIVPDKEIAYELLKNKKLNSVLVIGSGAGSDVLTAYKNGAAMIDAVEINPTTAELVINKFASYLGDIFKSDRVKLHVEDGRSFVRRSEKRYDVIMLFGVDSLSALSSGAYVMVESYLYTAEAISDYWDHLDKNGIIQISRWHYPSAPREELRAFVMAYDVLSRKGVSDPSRHLLVVGANRQVVGAPFADIMISRRPFQDEDVIRLQEWVKQYSPLTIIYNPLGGYNSYNMWNPFYAFYSFVRFSQIGNSQQFYKDYEFDVSPVTDDKPFFFQYGKWSHALKPYPMGPGYFESIQGRWPFLVLLVLIAQSILLVAFFVWVPFLRLRKNMGIVTPHMPIIFYFGLLGLGFMFVEISLIQKLVLLLGHPIYSMTVTIPTMLIAAGTGSLCTGLMNLRAKRPLLIAVLGICFFIIILVAASPAISQTLLRYSIITKIVVVIVLVFPLGFLMGMPFPMGIRKLSDFPQLIPIVWAANGGMSVIGSIVAIIIAMTLGFSYVFAIAAGLYLLAMICLFMWEKRQYG